MSDSLRATVLLSLQRALLGEVTVNLEAVAAAWSDRRIELLFYYRSSATEQDKESADSAALEVAADFPEHDVQPRHALWDDAATLPAGAVWVFMRRQPEQDDISAEDKFNP